MAGFAGCPARSVPFDQVLTRIASDLRVAEVTLFGVPKSASQATFDRVEFTPQLLCPETFSREYNPDWELVQHIERSQDTSRIVHLYVTDGVQSGATAGTLSPTVEALDRWITDGGALALIALRSRFEGKAWSEQARRWIGGVNVPNRPFYLFALARREADLEPVLERVEGIAGDSVQVLRITGGTPRCNVDATKTRRDVIDGRWVMLTSSDTRGIAADGGSIGTLRCLLPPGSPFGSIKIEVNTDYLRWTGNSFETAPLPAGSRVEIPAVHANGEQEIRVRLPGRGSRYGFYRLHLRPRGGELRQEVRDLSTTSDANADSFSRTFRLDWLIEPLSRTSLEQHALPTTFFVTLDYSDQ